MRQLTRLLRYVYPYTVPFLASVLLMALVGALDAFRVLLIGPGFDVVLNPAREGGHLPLGFNNPFSGQPVDLRQFIPHYFHNAWVVLAVALVGATVVKALCDYTGTYLVNYTGFGLITDLRNDLYGAIMRRSVAFFSRFATGTLLSTVVNDIEKVQNALSLVLADFLQQFFTFLFMAIAVGLTGRKLAWVLLVFIPIMVLSVRRIGRRVRSTTRRGQDQLADVQNILHETIIGNRIVKAFGMERWEMARFRTAAKRLFRANLRSVRASAISSPLMDVFGAIAIAGMLWVGRNAVRAQTMTPGKFLMFIVALFKLYDPVRKFAGFYNSFQQALGASESIFQVMDTRDDVKEHPQAPALAPFCRSIAFEDVSFCYDEACEQPVLRHIDLEIRTGEVLAIVGSSGAGKSSLVQLLPRFFDPTSGRILVDGVDLRAVSVASLRAQIGMVTQENLLFNDTVRNNIAYGQPQIAQEKVEMAAKVAMADSFIEKMPLGYNTIIGERGVRLSGGERQRIAIARAMLKDAPILILDEATSALDSENEALVQAALHNLMRGRTVFVIAHRLSTVRHANRIVVLEGGAIADIGTHDDLLSRLGTYRRLYEMQFVDLDLPRTAADGTPESVVSMQEGR